MVDYDKSTGSSGIMKIRDLGTTVEFWLYAGSATYDNQMYWSYSTPHGASGRLVYGFQGGAWRHLGSVNVTVSGNVNFSIEATGTSGLGGPTSHTVYLNRASAPNPPSISLSSVTQSSVHVTITDGANNGAAIVERQIGYGTSSSGPSNYVVSDGTTTVTGLAKGTRYYFWARTRNSQGWSGWSAAQNTVTDKEPSPPSTPSISSITQTSVYVTFTDGADNGESIDDREIGYGTSSSAPQTYVKSDKSTTISGLSPGLTYYFWARTKNGVGWSSLSGRATATLIAGAYVKVGTTWKRAVPYVNVSGVWKLAKPYAKSAGVWKETTS